MSKRYVAVRDPVHECALVVDLDNPDKLSPEVLAVTLHPITARKIADALNEVEQVDTSS